MIKNKSIELQSNLASMHDVEQFIEQIADEFNITNTYFGNIAIAVTEAVENAIKHGNKNDINKRVIIDFFQEPKGLGFRITDQGDGFDINSIKDPTDIENTDPSKGRGIYLMRSLADVIRFHENGRIIEIVFYISSINAELSMHRINQLNAYSKEFTTKKVSH